MGFNSEFKGLSQDYLSQWPTWCTKFFNTFITIFYMYRAIFCSPSGGQIVLKQHLVSSLSGSDCPVHRCTPVHRMVTYWEWRYQILYLYNLTSWGWTKYCSKHV